MTTTKRTRRSTARTGRGGTAGSGGTGALRLSRRSLLPSLAVLPAIAATIGTGDGAGPGSLVGARLAAAQDDVAAAAGNRSLRADDWPLIPGATVQVSGKGFTPGGKGRLLWQADTDAQRSLGLLRADKRGRVKASVTLPPSAADSFTLTARIGKGRAHASIDVRASTGTPIAFGIYERSRGEEAPWRDGPLQRLEETIGRNPAIIMWYQGWGAPNGGADLDLAMLDRVANRGAIPMITWEPWVPNGSVNQPNYKLSIIAAGTHDAYVREWATQLAAWGKPVLLRFAHEMNGTWYPWAASKNTNTAEDYVAAWKHLRRVFDDAGADKVGWVWSPNVDVANAGFTGMAALYPDDEFVDWIGLDGYNWGDAGGQRWQTFSQVFGASLAAIPNLGPKSASKPIMIAETASGSDGGSKAAWMRSAFFSEIPFDFPEIRAIVWFDENKERPWRFDTNSETTKAFRAAANHPYYAARLSAADIVTATGARRSTDPGDDRDRTRDRPRQRRNRRDKRR